MNNFQFERCATSRIHHSDSRREGKMSKSGIHPCLHKKHALHKKTKKNKSSRRLSMLSVLTAIFLGFVPEPCSGSSGPTCCKVGDECSQVGTAGCCQGAACGFDKSCWCGAQVIGAQKYCHACGNFASECHADTDCCDAYVCDPFATAARTCCVGNGGAGCRSDHDCCGGLTCEREHGVFSCT